MVDAPNVLFIVDFRPWIQLNAEMKPKPNWSAQAVLIRAKKGGRHP